MNDRAVAAGMEAAERELARTMPKGVKWVYATGEPS